jgi:hypothetical protein
MKQLILLCLGFMGLTACTASQNEDVVKNVSKNGSIEVLYKTKNLSDGTVELTMQYIVWKDGKAQRDRTVVDTLPPLGTMVATDEQDKSVVVPKEYEFFVTIQ